MKIEANNQAVWISGIVTLGVVIITLIFCCNYYTFAKAKAAFDKGLSEVNDTTQSTHYGAK